MRWPLGLLPLLTATVATCGTPDLPGEAGAAVPAERTVDTLPEAPADLRGIVTAREAGSVRVEVNPTEDDGSAKAVVELDRSTRVLYRNGEVTSSQELTIGHNVSVWFTGPVRESYPVQGEAATIVIEPVRGP